MSLEAKNAMKLLELPYTLYQNPAFEYTQLLNKLRKFHSVKFEFSLQFSIALG